ncbi:hypothetical protein OAH46_02480 [Verrucomicrobia bacterium]|nr:hypothetical protein [Verrucomicrobiota bacterium]
MVAVLCAVVACAGTSNTSAATIYVQAGSDGDGSSWEQSLGSLQSALNAAQSGDEIWVAAGTYTPSENDPDVSFEMKDGVDLYAGFNGTETSLDQRNWEKNKTILSGEIGDSNSKKDNSYHVLIAANSILDGFVVTGGNGATKGGPPAVGGPALGSGGQKGPSNNQMGPPNGQMGNPPAMAYELCDGKSVGFEVEIVTPMNTVLQATCQEMGGKLVATPVGGPPANGQMAPPSGGGQKDSPSGGPDSVGHMSPEQILDSGIGPGAGAGIVIWQVSPTIRNCTFVDNHAGKGGAFYVVGGGVGPFKQQGVEAFPTFINVTFQSNSAMGRGGAGSLDMGANGLFVDCQFIDNECAIGKGGAVYNDFGCSPLFENTLFVNNRSESGGAMGNDGESHPKFNNCTFSGNVANEAGAGIYQGSGPYNDPSVVNTIFWGNICEEDLVSVYDWNDCNTLVTHSVVEGGFVGEGVVDANPLFVDAKQMNFDLQEGSPALTASEDGGKIGFDASLLGTRSADDIKAILANLNSIPYNAQPVVLNLDNPVSSAALNTDILYVKPGSMGNGSDWDNALGSLQDAIDQANALYVTSNKPVQVWVAKGTYVPGDSRKDSIILRAGVELYGGFSGGEKTLAQRDIAKNTTLLSGDIGIKGDLSDNSYHVMIGSNDVILDGFTVSGGNANKVGGGDVYDNKGGAILNYHGGYRIRPNLDLIGFSPIIRNCTFTDNHAVEGGVIFTYHGGNPVFENSTFTDNSAVSGGVAVDRGGTNSKYTNCTFENNSVEYKGGAIMVDYGSMANIQSSTFKNNIAGSAGGAIYVIDRASQSIPNETDFDLIDPSWTLATDIFSSVLVENSRFEKNSAGSNGGAIYLYEGSYAMVNDSSFVDNSAYLNGDAMAAFNGAQGYINGSTLKGNSLEDFHKGDDTSSITVGQ